MLVLISVDVQYSQNAVYGFEKFSNRQKHSFSDSHHLVKKFPQQCSLLFDKVRETPKVLGGSLMVKNIWWHQARLSLSSLGG